MRLQTPRLRLREFEGGDLEAVHRYASDPEVTRYLFWGPNDLDETRAFIDRCLAEQRKSVRENYELAITLAADGSLIGGASLAGRRLEYAEYELGYCLARQTWGKGYAGEAARALIDFGFSELSAHRIYALVDPDNPASIRLVGQLGLQREGLQRRDTLIDGRWRDTLVYAALADEASES